MRDRLAHFFDRDRPTALRGAGGLRYATMGVTGMLVIGAALLGLGATASDHAGDFTGATDRRTVDDRAARGAERPAPSSSPSPEDSPSPTPTRPKPQDPTAESKQTEDSSSGGGPNVPIPASCDELSGNRAIGCALMLDEGFDMSEWGCLETLWDHESGWDEHAENPSSGAYGIPQALPGDKMADAGPDWQNNAATQITWGLGYIKGRYDTPCGAWSYWQSNGWY